MRILMSGSSGFLGGHLVQQLRMDGHQVLRLVRRPPRTDEELSWDPYSGELPGGALDGIDAVVNLSGVGVGDRRWSDAYRRKIRDSRVIPTRTLATAMAATGRPPAVMLNASAIGGYGDTGDRAVDESSPYGEGFFPGVCREWEEATRPAADAGVRVVRLRSGLVLAASGGLLKPMMPLFRLGLGGRLGSGRQYWSWITLADWLGAVVFLLSRDDVDGPLNLTAPAPVTNAEFTRELGRALHRPAVLPAPRFGLRIALGAFSGEVVTGQRVLPDVLTRQGFRFGHERLDEALTWALRH